MESTTSEKEVEAAAASSYTYWVREVREDAAPLPLPKKLNPDDLSNNSQQPPSHLGSAWNRAGTWEEKNLNKWASDRIKMLFVEDMSHAAGLKGQLTKVDPGFKELLVSVRSLEFSGGRAEITEVSKCVGDAFLVTVRNKKRVSYTYELTLRVKGEWLAGEEKKKVKGHIDIPEFSVGELDDLQLEVRLNEEKDLTHQDRVKIKQDLKLFLQPVREKLLQFEQELKDRQKDLLKPTKSIFKTNILLDYGL